MALTYSVKYKNVAGNARRHVVDITVGAAGDYSSGITVDPVACGMSAIDAIEPVGTDIGVNWVMNPTTGKLQAYKTGAALSGVNAEVAGADVATHVVRVVCVDYGATA